MLNGTYFKLKPELIAAVTLLKEDLMFSQCLKMPIIYLKEPEYKNIQNISGESSLGFWRVHWRGGKVEPKNQKHCLSFNTGLLLFKVRGLFYPFKLNTGVQIQSKLTSFTVI